MELKLLIDIAKLHPRKPIQIRLGFDESCNYMRGLTGLDRSLLVDSAVLNVQFLEFEAKEEGKTLCWEDIEKDVGLALKFGTEAKNKSILEDYRVTIYDEIGGRAEPEGVRVTGEAIEILEFIFKSDNVNEIIK
ncbi:hypothetical protein [Vibrio crassostreae]|uniref:hypothetical protein n=1 Tax=Vibrio crassostreae TaxID=246167 RepID=UPI001B3146F0|nr:hypothetical protein [Vibrio crassostreae]